MILSDDQIAAFKEAAKPLQDWLKKNTRPHCQADVSATTVTLTEGIVGINSLSEPQEPQEDFLQPFEHGN